MNTKRYTPTLSSCQVCKDYFGYMESDYDTYKVGEAATYEEVKDREKVVATIDKRNPELERVISNSRSSAATKTNVLTNSVGGLPRKNISPFRYSGDQR